MSRLFGISKTLHFVSRTSSSMNGRFNDSLGQCSHSRSGTEVHETIRKTRFNHLNPFYTKIRQVFLFWHVLLVLESEHFLFQSFVLLWKLRTLHWWLRHVAPFVESMMLVYLVPPLSLIILGLFRGLDRLLVPNEQLLRELLILHWWMCRARTKHDIREIPPWQGNFIDMIHVPNWSFLQNHR